MLMSPDYARGERGLWRTHVTEDMSQLEAERRLEEQIPTGDSQPQKQSKTVDHSPFSSLGICLENPVLSICLHLCEEWQYDSESEEEL
jgi:hypothetical protein